MIPILLSNSRFGSNMGIQRNAENQNETHAILNKIYKVFIFPIRSLIVKKKYYANVKNTRDWLPLHK